MNNHPATEDTQPPRPVHWGSGATLLWGIVIGIAFFLVQSATIILHAVPVGEHLPEAELQKLISAASRNGYAFSIATLITAAVCCALIAAIVRLRKGAVLTEYLALRPVAPGTMLRWAGCFVAFLALSDLLTSALGRPIVPEFMHTIYASANPAWVLWLALVFAAPLFEETFFRGFLLAGLQTGPLGPVGAVVITAGLWAIIHAQYDAYGIATVFVLGLFLGAARVFTGSLLVSLGLHALANFLATIETALWG